MKRKTLSEDENPEEVSNYYLTSNRFRKVVIIHKLGKSADKMYRALPQVYRTYDIKAKNAYNQTLDLPLYRYLCLIGYQYDKVENLISLILDNIDIDTCEDKFLPYLAKWLGVEYDWSISVTDNRVLIKMMIENYLRKGTYDGLKTLIQSISKSKVDIIVNKDLTPSHASMSAVNARRTIQVEIYLDSESDSWVGSRQEKVLKVVSQNVPKKNAYTVRVVVLIDFWDTYTKKVSDRKSKDKLVWKTSDNFTGATDNDSFDNIVDKLFVDKCKSGIDEENVPTTINYDVIYEPYGKKIKDDNSSTSVLGKFYFDDYTIQVEDSLYDKIDDSGNTDVYLRRDLVDPDISGTRGSSIRSKNLRGVKTNFMDMIYKNGELIEVRTYY